MRRARASFSPMSAMFLAGIVVSMGGLYTACQPQGGGSSLGSVELKGGSQTGPTVAEIGGRALKLGELQARLDRQSPFVRARYKTPEKKLEFLDSQVRFEVLAREALAQGLLDDPDVQETLKKALVQQLTRRDFDGKVKISDITDAEIAAYYQEHLDDYNKPEMVRGSVVRVSFGQDRKAARQKAESARAKALEAPLDDRNHFRRVVAEFSDHDETKAAGGDVRYLSRKDYEEQFGPAVGAAMWEVEAINAVTPVVEGKDGFYVLKKTGRRKPITRELDRVKNQIRNVLFREMKKAAFDTYVDGLKTKFNVKLHEGELEKLVVRGPEADPHAEGEPTPPPKNAEPPNEDEQPKKDEEQ